ncbi:alpha-amylase family protein [Quadrisphaera granulorum]|uniref:alpha-amylase family protein n=1 Tax=Quadrisphaera granulorum TaxID=317664 RepID=UPI003CCC7E6C
MVDGSGSVASSGDGAVEAFVEDVAGDLLSGLSADRRDLFVLRVERWWPDLRAGLAAVHRSEVVTDVERRLLRAAAAGYAEREADLHRLDQARTLRPDWFQEPSMLGYAAYTERYAGTLDGVRGRLDHLRELGVTYLHLMPVLQPREGDSDGGYAVADYRSVRSDLGDTGDLRELARALRAQGTSLVLDLVLNHVAREHEWARKAREGDPRYRAYFHVYADRTVPDAYERTLPEVFPDFAPGNFTWDEELEGWVWTTFNSFQWDVDWSNPDVLVEYADIILFLANLGVEVLRLDAIAFIWKRMGTDCQNQPEVHSLTQVLRALTRVACPGVLLKAEAIVSPQKLVAYLGQGEHHGRVSDLAYHNTLMVQFWSMLASQDVTLAAHTLRSLPPAPSSAAWITYMRCHDDIGWAVSDEDAEAVGLDGFAHRAFLSDWFSGAFPGSPARGLVFQENPVTRDRRISGSAAALTGLVAAQEAGNAAGIEAGIAKVLLGHALVMGWGGIPVLWMGDELGLRGDDAWASEPGHESDNRWAHRPWMDESALEARHDAATVPGRLFAGTRHLARVRASLPHLHAAVPSQVLELHDPGVLPVLRRHPVGDLLGLYNPTAGWRTYPGWRLAELGLAGAHDALTGRAAHVGDDGNVWLAPWSAAWLHRP